jgi:2-oxoacid:acceptor oxidoreductase gamma subunit (pyruvate/2-ketoisovalerate family)
MKPLQDAVGSAPAGLPDGVRLPLEIRVHGRGGQGGVTCAKLIAALYARLGLAVQTFGDYGSERSGAPVQAFTRVDRNAVTNRNKVYRPDHLLVLDPGLLETPVLSGVSPGALILLNSAAPPALFGTIYRNFRFAAVDATEIAREQGIGSSSVVIINTTIIGAYLRLLDLPLSLLEDVFGSLGLSGDLAAAAQAYHAVQIQEPATASLQSPELNLPVPDSAAVPPIGTEARDIPTDLRTGLWSNQSPVYRQYTAPCNAACPAGNDIVGFVQALKNGGPEAAAAILLRTQALPSVCGRVCPAPCMNDCNRKSFDGAVNIRSLERWIADHAGFRLPAEPAVLPRRLAVVGSGPAGLSAAYQLALRGHRVTIYEAAAELGGVLRYGIPAFRLPLEVLERDLSRILSLGVNVCCGKPVSREDLARLSQEHDALVICTGLGGAHGLGVPGEELPGVEQGLPFLERVKAGAEKVSGHVVVVGGGNSALDCARSALRCGAETVRVVYRRNREDMPAIEEEITEAEQEGIRLMTRRQPVLCAGEGRVTGLVLAEVEAGAPDASGRRRPVVTDRTALLPCDRVLLALGQGSGLELLPADWQVRGTRAFQGDQPLKVWFAGDCCSGEGTVTHAIGNGRRVALALLADLDPSAIPDPSAASDQSCATNREPNVPSPGGGGLGRGDCPTDPVIAPAQIRFSHFEPAPPGKDRHLPLAQSRSSFQEFNLGLSGPQEAQRCFSCGQCTKCDTCLVYCPDGVIYRSADGYRVDLEHCKGCGMCVAECPRCAMEMNEKRLPGGAS